MSRVEQQLQKMQQNAGFIAALDQSGGSTPKALQLYGISEDAWSGEEEMYRLVHQMRTRIIASQAFDGRRILGAILFENTMDRAIAELSTADYLWEVKRIVPFLKVDQGLQPELDGVQLMKPIGGLSPLLGRARQKHVFGTKMRSVIKHANTQGIAAIVEQQFAVAAEILDADLVPIIEPEIDIHCPDKHVAEKMLKAALLAGLESLKSTQRIMFKLTLPDEDDFYSEFVTDPRVLRVVALSGGYTRVEANARLARNHGVVASFSRALAEGLTAQQSEPEFNELLDRSIENIYQASIT